MAQFELTTYGANDEVLKHFETDRVRWGLFAQAVKLNDDLEKMEIDEQFAAIGEFVKKMFVGMTDADLENADVEDVMNTFAQLVRKGRKIGAGQKPKNAQGAAK